MRLTSLARASLFLALPCAGLNAQSVAGHDRVRQATQLLQTWLEAQRYALSLYLLGSCRQELLVGRLGYADIARQAPATARHLSIVDLEALQEHALPQLDAGRLVLTIPSRAPLGKNQRPRRSPARSLEDFHPRSGLPRESDHVWKGPDCPIPPANDRRAHCRATDPLSAERTTSTRISFSPWRENSRRGGRIPTLNLIRRNILSR